MDKYAGYVIVVYVVTFLLLAAYLAWMWLRLRELREEERE
ncbi:MULTISPECIES: heme exporter protein CcmD [Deinococcus]|nr:MULTISPECIES: heme exporter protein CcmD [Deinococcus]MBI0445478.1 heme exporter protein CcmD [Deinococcus sp. DB0503]